MKFFFHVLFLFISFGSISQTVRTYANAGTFTWVCPFDVTSIIVECWGGGGAGGAATGNIASAGGGAGGGYVYNASIPVVPNTTYTIRVGAGGVASATLVKNGGSSWFGSVSTIFAIGGNGGDIASGASSVSNGGASVSSGNVNGTISTYGGAGATAILANSGGSGGGAGTSVNGNPGVGINGGAAVAGGGAGSLGRSTSAAGIAGGVAGAGGSGGRTANNTDRLGGAGAKGKVVITYSSSGIIWNGTGVSGGVIGTDFNTAANWLPNTVPGGSDIAIINTTTAVTITLSASVTIGTLNMLNNATTNIASSLDLVSSTLTVNDDLILNINSICVNTGTSCYVKIGSGDLIVNGNALLGNNANTASKVGICGNAAAPAQSAGNCKFYGNVTFGVNYNPNANCFGSFIWDGIGTQSVIVNRLSTVPLYASCQIGGVNTPTVTFPSSNGFGVQVRITAVPGNLTVKNGSTLELTSKTFSRSGGGGSLILEANSKLIVGSTFPASYTTMTLDASSEVLYNGTSAQSIVDVAAPGYGLLTLTNNSTKSAATGLDIQNDFTINSTATFAAGASLTHNLRGNWITNGTFSYTTSSTINLNGASAQNIGGTTVPSLKNFTNSNSGGLISLTGSLLVTGTLSMSGTNSDLNLNGNNIDLSTTGSLVGESATDKIYGTSGTITRTAILNAPSAVNVGGLGCSLTSSVNMGSTIVTRGHSSLTGIGVSSSGSLERYYSISPTNNSNLGATMVFNYFDSELNGITETALKLFRSVDGGANWTDRGGLVDATANTITLSGIDAFSIWTPSTPDIIVLPIKLTTFQVEKNGRSNLLSWITMTEVNNDFFTLERSVDGKVFEFIESVNGAGSSSLINSYSYIDNYFLKEINYYRLKQTDFDGVCSYSDLISIDNREVVKTISKIVNLYGQEVDSNYKGAILIIYSDNSILRTFQN